MSSLVRDAKLNASEAKHNATKMALSKTHGAMLFYKEALEAEQVSHNATKAALAAFIDAMDKYKEALRAEQVSHQATAWTLDLTYVAMVSYKEALDAEIKAHALTRKVLEYEKEAHRKTWLALKAEQMAHNATNMTLNMTELVIKEYKEAYDALLKYQLEYRKAMKAYADALNMTQEALEKEKASRNATKAVFADAAQDDKNDTAHAETLAFRTKAKEAVKKAQEAADKATKDVTARLKMMNETKNEALSEAETAFARIQNLKEIAIVAAKKANEAFEQAQLHPSDEAKMRLPKQSRWRPTQRPCSWLPRTRRPQRRLPMLRGPLLR